MPPPFKVAVFVVFYKELEQLLNTIPWRGLGGGALLGILGGVVQPSSPNPDPISDQKM